MFVIKRNDGAYVADMRLSNASYTSNVLKAKVFHTRQSAENDRCPENEYVVDIGYNDLIRNRLSLLTGRRL